MGDTAPTTNVVTRAVATGSEPDSNTCWTTLGLLLAGALLAGCTSTESESFDSTGALPFAQGVCAEMVPAIEATLRNLPELGMSPDTCHLSLNLMEAGFLRGQLPAAVRSLIPLDPESLERFGACMAVFQSVQRIARGETEDDEWTFGPGPAALSRVPWERVNEDILLLATRKADMEAGFGRLPSELNADPDVFDELYCSLGEHLRDLYWHRNGTTYCYIRSRLALYGSQPALTGALGLAQVLRSLMDLPLSSMADEELEATLSAIGDRCHAYPSRCALGLASAQGECRMTIALVPFPHGLSSETAQPPVLRCSTATVPMAACSDTPRYATDQAAPVELGEALEYCASAPPL